MKAIASFLARAFAALLACTILVFVVNIALALLAAPSPLYNVIAVCAGAALLSALWTCMASREARP